MRAFQQEVVALALGAAEPFGFALSGGQALTAHGISDRPSDDGDLFTNNTDPYAFDAGVDAAVS